MATGGIIYLRRASWRVTAAAAAQASGGTKTGLRRGRDRYSGSRMVAPGVDITMLNNLK